MCYLFSRLGQSFCKLQPRHCEPVRTLAWQSVNQKKKPPHFCGGFVFALPIFPGSRPPSIVGVHELNFCVRDGNRWTLMTINTNYLDGFYHRLYQAFRLNILGDPYRIRTDVNGVRGRCLNHLTNGPLVHLHGLEPGTH